MTGTIDLFCPHCGTKGREWARFCASCGQAYDSALAAPHQPASVMPPPLAPPAATGWAQTPNPTTPPPAPTAPGQSTQVTTLAGIAWIICAALTGYLAFIQLGYAGTIVDDGSLPSLALWNGVTAALTLSFGAKLLTKPDRGFLGTSTAWAALVVLWNGYNIMNGATHEAYIGATVAALAAGVLSWSARSGMAATAPQLVEWETGTATGEAPNAYRQAQARPAWMRLMIALGVIVVIFGGLWVVAQILSS